MKPTSLKWTIACQAVATMLGILPQVASAADAELLPLEQLPAACREAKAQFRPLTEQDATEAKAQLLAALAKLDERLEADGANGQQWRAYLLWSALQEQLQRGEKPEPKVLERIYKRYTADHPGLMLVWFQDAKDALRRYRFTLGAIDSPALKKAFDELLENLAQRLQAYTKKPNDTDALAIGATLGQLAEAGQVPGLIAAVRHYFARPNLYAELSADLVGVALSEDIDQTAPVRDEILDTAIRGTGHTVGQVTAKLVPDTQRAVVDTIFLGITKTQNVGTNGPVTIHSNGTIGIGAAKRIWVDAQGIHSLPAVANTTTETQFTGIHANRQFIERIARNRAYQQKGTAEAIASQHAEQRVCSQIDDQADSMIHKANENFQKKFRQPLERYRLFPQQLDFSTSETALTVVALEGGQSQLAAATAPPALSDNPGMTLQLHESMIENFAASALAGRTVPDATFEDIIVNILGELPENMRRSEDQDPWAIRFDPHRPVSVTFAEDGFEATIRGRRYHVGEESYPGMNVTAKYKIVQDGDQWKAVRDEDLQIYPPGFKPEAGKKLSTRQVVIRTMLDRRFGKIFEKEILLEDIVMPEERAHVGKLRPVIFQTSDGWLTLAWKRLPPEATLAETP